MALEAGTPTLSPPAVRVMISELQELNFALFLDKCGEEKPGHKRPQWLLDFMRDHTDLYERIANFWESSPGYHAWDEMLVYANHTGTLLDETLDRYFARLPGAMEQRIEVPPMPSETPDVPPIVADRLERLRSSAELRERYLSLLKDAWAVLGQTWRANGRDAVLEAARNLQRGQPSTVEALRKLMPGVTMLRKEQYEPLITAGLERNEVVVVPLYLAADGQSLFAMPGLLYIGMGLESGRKIEAKREQAEQVANRMKVLSDPTRVAILRQLMHDSFTITDLANYFELSQPTVSVHMKALREADLVESEKTGNQTRYRVAGPRVWQYVTDALGLIGIEAGA